MARSEPRCAEIASGVLVVGVIAHALLCGPAIGCRGYPPIAPIWYGVTFIWPVAVMISAYFDSTKFANRRKQLIIFAFSTAFFMAGTMVTVVPRRMGPVEMLFGTVFFGPIHLLITFAVEFTIQFIYSFGRTLVENRSDAARSNFSLFSFLTLIGWIALILGIPLGYQSLIESNVNNNAIKRADSDWETNALVYRDYEFEQIGDVSIDFNFDPETGLQYKRRMSDLGFADRYNARISQLIELHGIPQYSIKHIIPNPNDFAKLLDATDLDIVDSFPLDLSKNIHLMRRGSLSRWGGTSTSGSDSLSVVTPHMHMGAGDGVLPVHYKKTDDIIYIRNGPDWVGAFLHDGRMVMSASRCP